MQSLRSASFDLYGRYSHVFRIRTESLPAEPIRILDVGDPFGTIASLFPEDQTVSLDIYEDHPSFANGHQPVIGSGFELPFVDGSFDLVCTHDVLEHIPGDRRTEFIAELLRVSRGPVVLVAPFGDPRSARAEQLINSYFVARTGRSIDALDEHEEFVLPDTQSITGWLESTGVPFAHFGDGWVYHWVAFYYLKAHLFATGAELRLRRMDEAFNELLVEPDRTAPHYRTTLVMRPPASLPNLPPAVPAPGADEVAAGVDELTQLALTLSEALASSEDIFSRNGRLAAWIAERASSNSTVEQKLAASLTTALDACREVPLPAAVAQVEPASPRLPKVAVVLINWNGIDHLRPCLDSLAAQDYPKDLTEVILVDNASTDGSLELLARDYPWVRVLPQAENTGFAPATTTGVQAATAECVAFVNIDMRADPSWLSELVKAYDPQNNVVCVSGQIRSWEGDKVDFVEGVMNFYGMGDQVGYGKLVGDVDVRDGQKLLFACGGAMLVSRHVYLTTGGFDPDFFMYFEDVDFGWRLWVLGYEVRFAEHAITFHHGHGASSRIPEHQMTLVYERNGLRSIMKNYSDELLAQVLAPALMLLTKRAVTRGGLDAQRAAYSFGGDREPTEVVSRTSLSHVHAINDVIEGLDGLIEERTRIQRARQREDAEILGLFGKPFFPVLHNTDFVEAQQKVVDGFGLANVFTQQRASRVLCISSHEIGEKMRGPAIRAFEIAKALSSTVPVAVAVPGNTDSVIEGIPALGYPDEETLVRLASASDVVIIQGFMLRNAHGLGHLPNVLVVDLYDPWLFENIELHGEQQEADVALKQDVAVINELLDAGDFFICASERQRDYWLGMLSARGALDSATYAADPTLRQLIDVVPFGLEKHPPRHTQNVLKGVHPNVAEDDLVVLWGGGVWDWFDPLSVIEAFAIVVERIPNAKLYFLGLELSSPDVPPMKMAEAVVLRSKQLGLFDTSIIFGDWAPYEMREAFLLEADIAVSAAKDLAETRLAFRSRILDYLWAGLPVVTTSGDVLSDLVQQEELGIVVPPGNINLLANAMLQLLGNPARRAAVSARAAKVAEGLQWSECVAPLRKVALEPWRWRTIRQARERGRLITQDVQMLFANRDEEMARLRADRDELVFLRKHAEELEEIVRHKDRPYALVRKTPGIRRLASWAKRALASLR